jgi:hypothetical protein
VVLANTLGRVSGSVARYSLLPAPAYSLLTTRYSLLLVVFGIGILATHYSLLATNGATTIHSARRASTGLTWVARHAGSQQASSTMDVSSSGTPTNVAGSTGLTP